MDIEMKTRIKITPIGVLYGGEAGCGEDLGCAYTIGGQENLGDTGMAETRKCLAHTAAACRPELTGVREMEVAYGIEGLMLAPGAILASFQKEAAGIPGCVLACVEAEDEAGALPLKETERREYPVVTLEFAVGRASVGEIRLRYRCVPRVLDETGRRGPLLDFRGEPGGAAGAGEAFLMQIPGEGSWELSWDLSRMPEGSLAVGTFGGMELNGKMDDLLFSYYAVGDVHAEEEGQFGVYWIGNPPFDLAELAARTRAMFGKMAEFFEDPDPLYRIFVRRDPFCPSGSGTALNRCYMFGYCGQEVPSVDALQNLLAHEMVHNWPHLLDEPYGSTAWYTEGTAEYYSVMLPLRFGFATLEQALEQIQSRTDRYYTNPVRHLSDAEAAGQFWSDLRTQRISYGRGFFFLGHTDAEIRKATGGAHSLDDVVLELVKLHRARCREGRREYPAAEDFRRVASEYLGRDYGPEIEKMASGEEFPPDVDGFGGLFGCEEVLAVEEDTGKAARSYRWFVRGGAAKL